MKNKESVKEKEQRQELESNRLTFYTALTVVAVVFVALLYRYASNLRELSRFKTAVYTLLVGAALSAGWALVRMYINRNTDGSATLVPPFTHFFLSALAGSGAVFMRFFYADAVKLFYVLVPALYVLHLILHVYGNAYFFVSAFLLASGSALYTFDRLLMMGLFSGMRLAFGSFLILIGLAFVTICIAVSKKSGALRWKGSDHILLRGKTNYLPGYLSGAAVSVIGVTFAWIPAYAIFYGLIAIGALLVLCGIYFTFALMYS